MRISDWSSDVCSSDLLAGQRLALEAVRGGGAEDQVVVFQGGQFRRGRRGGDHHDAGRDVDRVGGGQSFAGAKGADHGDYLLDVHHLGGGVGATLLAAGRIADQDRKSTRLNSSH